MKWEDVSEKSRVWLDDLGHFSPTVHQEKRELKGWDDEGKCYLSSDDLREIAAACTEAADWLDKRAALAASGEQREGV